MSESAALFIVISVAIATTNAVLAQGSSDVQSGLPDAFRVFQHFPYAVAIFDSNNDTIFECLTAYRKHFDPVAKEVTYLWSLNQGPGQKRKHITFHSTEGPTPDTAICTVEKEENRTGLCSFRYSDYNDCAIVEQSTYGHQCTLWVRREIEDRIPVHCLVPFGKICQVAVPVHDSDLCVDDETDDTDD
ncbi:uncharacterized protein LOC144152652 [Haemaphysalis longicornis]